MYMVEGMLVYLTAQRCTMFKLRAEHGNIKRHVCEHAHCWGHGGGLEEHMCVYMFALSGGTVGVCCSSGAGDLNPRDST